MRLIPALVTLAACALATAQAPKVGSATAVDVGVTSIEWHPAGRALFYIRESENSKSLGVYAQGAREGTVLLTMGKEDILEARWFDAEQCLVAMIYHYTADSSTVTTSLLDAKKLVAHTLFSESFDRTKTFKIDLFGSPSQLHAIFRINEDNSVKHLVLPSGGHRVVDSPDLDQAYVEGIRDPVWSVDGTAIFSGAGQAGGGTSYLAAYGRMSFASQQQESKVPVLGGLPIIGRLFWTRPVIPETGANVLELMPSNAVLRPVRFRGPFEPKEAPVSKLQPRESNVELKFGASRGTAKSLWLSNGVEATLIAAHADEAWLGPWARSIAYLIDSALFVRFTGNAD